MQLISIGIHCHIIVIALSFFGYMLLYLMTIQTIALFCVHLMPTMMMSTVFNVLISIGLISVGGYSVHPRDLSKYWSWSQLISPEKWLLPVIVKDEYSTETLINSAGLQLCRNKQVQHQEIIVQQPCPPPNGTQILADFLMLPENHILETKNMEQSTVLALISASIILFIVTVFIFILNCRKMFVTQKQVQ